MAENRYCKMHLKNTTNGTLTLASDPLSWGKWNTTPPTQILSNTEGFFEAQGRKDSATGTQGTVTYTFSDNATNLTISFDIPYSQANSGGMTLGGASPSQYTGGEYDSSYTNITSFPTSGNGIEVYFQVGVAPSAAGMGAGKKHSFHFDMKSKFGPVPAAETMNIADVARRADCGEIPSDLLIQLFQGKTEATLSDILHAPNIASGTLVQFVTRYGMVPPQASYNGALDCASNVAGVIANPEVGSVIQELLSLLKEIQLHPETDTSPIEQLTYSLQDAKALMLAGQSQGDDLLNQVAAVDSVLACVFQDATGSLEVASSCARDTATSNSGYDQVSAWQLDYLKNVARTL